MIAARPQASQDGHRNGRVDGQRLMHPTEYTEIRTIQVRAWCWHELIRDLENSRLSW